jgi:putative endonuclease
MLAATWLQEKGWVIIERNWRVSRYEIDIIASKNHILHFVEVKTRRSLSFGHPEESVSDKKMDSLMRGAEMFLEKRKGWNQIQFDVLSITMLEGKPIEYFLIEDVYL